METREMRLTAYRGTETLRDRGYNGVNVDRTHYAVEWCRERGFEPAYKAVDQHGNTYTVWEKREGTSLLMGCAIPEKMH